MLAVGLFLLGALIFIVAVVVIFLNAFSKSRLWGLAGLILLAPLLAHAFLNWSVATVRRGFYGLVIGLLTVLVSITGGALAHLPFLTGYKAVQALEKNIAPAGKVPLANQEQADATALSKSENYDPLITGSEYEKVSEEEIIASIKQAPSSEINTATGPNYQVVAEDDFIHAINQSVRIKLRDGKIVTGKLVSIIDASLLVESIVEGGFVGLSYGQQDIALLEVLLPAGERLYIPEGTQTRQQGMAVDPGPENATLREQTLTPVMRSSSPAPQAPEKVIPAIIDNRRDTVQQRSLGSAPRNSN